ncbi:MAG TPA: hypothetical protein PLW65_15265, partial [Pseudomonadota bacterium]|nr:hypothetical protein [Pseudomonadota bacterium]
MFRSLLVGTTLVLLAAQSGGCQRCPPNAFDCNWPPPPLDAGTDDIKKVIPPTIPGCVGSCQVDPQCPVGYSTKVSGTVTIPAGTLPLPGVQVAIPTGSSLPLPPGTGPTCAPAGSPELSTFTTSTDIYGHFDLFDIPSGDNIPLVIRVGKWQRIITLPKIAPCTRTVLPAEQTRLPRNQLEGSIPQLAVSTGGEDALECLLRSPKLGLDDAEFTAATGTGRVHLYAGASGANSFTAALGGASFGAAQPLPAKSWYDDITNWSKYDAVLLSCEGAEYMNYKSPQALQNMERYLGAGGRVLATHFHSGWLKNAQPPQTLQSVATFGASTGPDPVTDTIDLSPNMGGPLASWLSQDTVLGSTTAGQLLVRRPGYSITGINSDLTQRWISYQPATGPAVAQVFSFVAPVGVSPVRQCGRMLFSDIHATSGPSGDSSAAGTP